MKFFIYLLYRYYSTGGKWTEIAYQKAVSNLLLIFVINILTLLRLFDLNLILHWILLPFLNDPLLKFTGGLVELLPFYLILILFFKKRNIASLKYEEEKIKKGNRFLLLYIVGSLIFFFIVISVKSKLT